MHSMLDNRNHSTQLFSHPILTSTLDQTLHGLQRTDLAPPPFTLIQDHFENVHDLPRSLWCGNLDDRVHSGLSGRSNGLGLVHQEVQKVGDDGDEETFATFSQTLGETFDENPSGFTFGLMFTLTPRLDDGRDFGGDVTFGVGLVGG